MFCDKASKQEVIAACHDDITAGHFGFEKTFERVQAYAYWPDMVQDLKGVKK